MIVVVAMCKWMPEKKFMGLQQEPTSIPTFMLPPPPPFLLFRSKLVTCVSAR